MSGAKLVSSPCRLIGKPPSRIQLSRKRGWRMPSGAVAVSRPSRWGNPYRVKPITDRFGHVEWIVFTQDAPSGVAKLWREEAAIRQAVALYRADIVSGRLALDMGPLRGRDLACWCPLSSPCHADVLIELANAP